ncbi:MAG: YlxM family DNA-binding protein [Bacillota bacterium]|nr:YlxM family DNA-binding protein [Bacillota bacterium]
MLDQLHRINLLCDIYASLLTERQQEIMKLYFSDNYSLAEIADEYRISRQAVHDVIKRTLSAVEKFEEKLGLYALFKEQQKFLDEADELLSESGNSFDEKDRKRLREIIAALRSGNEK